MQQQRGEIKERMDHNDRGKKYSAVLAEIGTEINLPAYSTP